MSAPVDYFDSESLRKDLGGKTVRGGVVIGAAQVFSVSLTLIAIPVLSRLLDKEDFGLIALVTAFTSFAALLSDGGLSMASVQRKELTHQQASNLFWVSACLGLVVMLGVLACSPLLAWFYDDSRLLPITAALSVNFFLNGLTVQPSALLRRAMRFRLLVIPQLSWVAIQQGLAIAWAWCRRGEPDACWALVVSPIVATLVRGTLILTLCGWLPSRPRRGSGVRELLGFGFFFSGSSAVHLVADQADAVVLGAVVPFAELGTYDRAKKLLLYPLRTINRPLSGVVIPALSRTVDTPVTYRSLYSGAISMTMLVVAPAAAVSMICPDWCVELAFGQGWDNAVEVLRLLSPAMLLVTICNGTSWQFTSQGRVKELLYWQTWDAATRVFMVLIGAITAGLTGVALATSTRYLLVTPVFYAVLGRRGPYGFRDFLRLVTLSALAMAAAAAAVLLVRETLLQQAGPLSRIVGVAAASFVASSLVFASDASIRSLALRAFRLVSPKLRSEKPAET